ncbi:MAG: DUF411 domain-containing protein [Hyphomicrobiaceae bacterium]
MNMHLSLYSRRAMLGLIATTAVASAKLVWAEPLPAIKVWKDPSCGCCSGWVAHLRKNGFTVTVVETADMQAVKARLGVAAELASCHTAEISGYVIEGHVPAQAITRLLTEKPDAIGLSAPGMPAGSPGMEGGIPEAFDVIQFGKSGQRSFGRYLGERPV